MEDADYNNMFFFLFNLDITYLPISLSNFSLKSNFENLSSQHSTLPPLFHLASLQLLLFYRESG